MQEMQETQVWSLGLEDPLAWEMTTHSSILAWKIPWTEEPGKLQSMRSQEVGYNWVTKHTHTVVQDDTFVGTRWRVTGNFPLLFFVMAYPSATILKWKIKNKKHYFKILVSKCTLRQTFSLFTFFSQYCKHTKNINILKKKKKDVKTICLNNSAFS